LGNSIHISLLEFRGSIPGQGMILFFSDIIEYSFFFIKKNIYM